MGLRPAWSMQLGVFSTAYGAGVAGNAFSTAGDIKEPCRTGRERGCIFKRQALAGGFAAWRIKNSGLSDEEGAIRV